MGEDSKRELDTESVDETEAQHLVERFKQVDAATLRKILEDNPNEGRKMVTVVQRTMTTHSGPLPPVEILKGYESILPGAAERVFKMAEREQNHRHAIDNKSVELQGTHLSIEATKSSRGQIYAFIVVILCLLVVAFLGYHGIEIVASVLAGATIVSLAWAFISGRRPSKNVDEDER